MEAICKAPRISPGSNASAPPAGTIAGGIRHIFITPSSVSWVCGTVRPVIGDGSGSSTPRQPRPAVPAPGFEMKPAQGHFERSWLIIQRMPNLSVHLPK